MRDAERNRVGMDWGHLLSGKHVFEECNVFEQTTLLFLWTSSSTLNMFYMLKSFFDDKPGKIFNDSQVKSLTNKHGYSPPHSSILKYVRNNLVQKYKHSI